MFPIPTDWQVRQIAVMLLVLVCSVAPHHMPDPPLAMYTLRGIEGMALGILLWSGFRLHWTGATQILVFEGSVSACAKYTYEGELAQAYGMCEAATGLPVTSLALAWGLISLSIILGSKDGRTT